MAALGENVIPLVNLTWSVVLYLRFLRGRGTFAALEKWQTDYLPVFSAWAAIVVIPFPPVFGYIWPASPAPYIESRKRVKFCALQSPPAPLAALQDSFDTRRPADTSAKGKV